MRTRSLFIPCAMALSAIGCHAQQSLSYALESVSDSLSWLILVADTTTNGNRKGGNDGRETPRAMAKWRLPYPVYRLATGDIDGDGKKEALVGVIKPTRFDPQPARRLFIFKQVNGRIRPMWMGSQLGGILRDFRFVGHAIRTLQMTTDGKYVVAEYAWDDFGLTFVRFLAQAVSQQEAEQCLKADGNSDATQENE